VGEVSIKVRACVIRFSQQSVLFRPLLVSVSTQSCRINGSPLDRFRSSARVGAFGHWSGSGGLHAADCCCSAWLWMPADGGEWWHRDMFVEKSFVGATGPGGLRFEVRDQRSEAKKGKPYRDEAKESANKEQLRLCHGGFASCSMWELPQRAAGPRTKRACILGIRRVELSYQVDSKQDEDVFVCLHSQFHIDG
jgi:hypothetical protein